MIQRNKYLRWGLTVFGTVSGILLFYDTVFGSRTLILFVLRFFHAMLPVIYGAAMAYLLSPMVNFFDRAVKQAFGGGKGTKGRQVSLGIRSLSILLTWAVIGFGLYLLGSFLVPELIKSVLQLLENIETYYMTISGWIEKLLDTYPELEHWAIHQMDTYYGAIQNWVTSDLLPQATQIMSIVSGGIFGFVRVLGDLLVGIFVSVYFMATKETCAAQSRRILYGLLSREKVYWILRGIRRADFIFAGFVRGKLLDSLIIGILCFLGCSALKFPYTPLVSVIVGVTNVIPFFGPFLGAIPSGFLILLASPRKTLYFVLFVVALQQLDGNVIGPKILGDKTGLSSLWVIFAILVGGSFFGVAGMFFGVPVCACLYGLVNFLVDTRLRRRKLPVEMDAYFPGGLDGSDPGTAPPEKK